MKSTVDPAEESVKTVWQVALHELISRAVPRLARAMKRPDDSGGPDAGAELAVARQLRRRLNDSASEGGSESGETERRRSRRREAAAPSPPLPGPVDQPLGKRHRSPDQPDALLAGRPVKKLIKFRKPANITAKNRAAALLTKTGKKKKKPFKGLSYSFGRKRKRVKKEETAQEDELGVCYVKELNPSEAKKLEEVLGEDSEEVDEEMDAEAGDEIDAEAAEELGDEAIEEIGVTAIPEAGHKSVEGNMFDVQNVAPEELEQNLCAQEVDATRDDIREMLLKGKARKSIPQVILKKKSFIPSAVRDISPDSSSDEFEDEEVIRDPADVNGSVASAVKLRRSSVTQPAVPYSRLARGDSLTGSPAGSVTGGSGAGEAAPPEGTVPPAKMMDPVLTSISCKCVEAKTPLADLDLAKRDYYCRGIDAIDGRLVGCCNLVTTKRMIRPSFKVPFLLMCGLHRERMRRHHCCPSCGVFCTQGIFMRCTHECSPHLFHRKCAAQVGELLMCSHCGNMDDLRMVQLTIRTGRTPTFYHQQGTVSKSRSARMAFSRELELGSAAGGFSRPSAHLSPYRLTLPDGRVLAANWTARRPGPGPAGAESAGCDAGGRLHRRRGQDRHQRPAQDTPQLRPGQTAHDDRWVRPQGWSPNQKYRECGHQTALHLIVQQGHVAAAHVLVTAGACLDPVDRDLQTPLMMAASRGQNDVLKYLVTAGGALNAKGEDGMTPLHLAAQAGNIEGCHYLLSSGRTESGYVNLQDDGGWTPVVWASEHKHPAVVKYLLERGANPQLCDEEQNTGLHWAAYSGSMEIAELFLTAGCQVNSPNVHGDTPLHIASRQQHYECVLLMLAHGANVYLRNREGMLALDCCGRDRSETQQALLLNMELSQLASRSGARRGERVLSNDVSRGKEKLPIQAVNECDDTPLPTDYVYISESCETMKLNIDKTITSLQSCNCLDNCLSSDCMCSQISLRCWYDPDGRLLPEFNYTDPPMIFECNRACGCNQLTCNNRAVQHGITARVQLYRTPDRGWGVRALRHIPKGTYVCEYVGELITDSAADQREDDSYLFDLDNRDGDTFCIDARRYGNVARFINHRCEPNLVPVKVFVDHQDVRFPRIALFTCRDVEPAEELGFDYGEKFWIIKYKMFTCKCGSMKCKYSSETIHLTLANYNRKLAEAEQKHSN
ncbi:histone-lysine N-methyltransferase EHMT2-like [Pollicipes pollicipes]|uniref:histone-lysine N-methyltransferase EHMT2-like n=1 Tax=Pollicipes pollicipes TaxID=41117 RepID=UPI0018859C2E|nr:histone-lysine N-methyltransferase EHMT2-like [Pollicipes pollicipes]